jgi:hypothetical protein
MHREFAEASGYLTGPGLDDAGTDGGVGTNPACLHDGYVRDVLLMIASKYDRAKETATAATIFEMFLCGSGSNSGSGSGSGFRRLELGSKTLGGWSVEIVYLTD